MIHSSFVLNPRLISSSNLLTLTFPICFLFFIHYHRLFTSTKSQMHRLLSFCGSGLPAFPFLGEAGITFSLTSPRIFPWLLNFVAFSHLGSFCFVFFFFFHFVTFCFSFSCQLSWINAEKRQARITGIKILYNERIIIFNLCL